MICHPDNLSQEQHDSPQVLQGIKLLYKCCC